MNTDINTTIANEDAIPELVRANKLTVKTDTETGTFIADFYKTHKHVASIRSIETGFKPDADSTSTANREAFRKFMAEHAADIGVNYDPADRRIDKNVRKASYLNQEELSEDAIAMVTPDIEIFMSKMPHAELVAGWDITIDSMTPKTKTSKGSDLVMMGIENGCYSSGKLAWFDIDATVVIRMAEPVAKGVIGDKDAVSGTEIYQTLKLELVSGQLKKFRMTQTQWNTETIKSMVEAGVIVEEDTKAKPAKAESSKTEESATAEPTEPAKEDKKEQADKPKRTRKTSKKSDKETKVEG